MRWSSVATMMRPTKSSVSSFSQSTESSFASAAWSGPGKTAMISSPMVFTTRPPCPSQAIRTNDRQRPMAFSASASPTVSYSLVLPLTSANNTATSVASLVMIAAQSVFHGAKYNASMVIARRAAAHTGFPGPVGLPFTSAP